VLAFLEIKSMESMVTSGRKLPATSHPGSDANAGTAASFARNIVIAERLRASAMVAAGFWSFLSCFSMSGRSIARSNLS
jgi:hypothetical protein